MFSNINRLRDTLVLGKHIASLIAKETELSRIYDRIQHDGGKVLKKKELRASAFPVCPLLFLDAHLNPRSSHANTYHSEYHTRVGHYVHAYLQEKIIDAGGGQIFGNFKCKCGCEYNFTTDPDCPKCGERGEYVEVEVKFGNLSGHIDGLLIFRKKQADGSEVFRIQVFDYKTFSLTDLKRLPSKKHLLQAAIYAVLVERELKRNGIDALVDSISILYVAKDKPTKRAEFNIQMTDELRREARFMVSYANNGYDKFLDLLELIDLPSEEREAARDEIHRELLELYELRTCNGCQTLAPELQPIQFYEQRVKPFFFEKIENPLTEKTHFIQACPLDKQCFRQKEWLNNTLGDVLYGTREVDHVDELVASGTNSPFV